MLTLSNDSKPHSLARELGTARATVGFRERALAESHKTILLVGRSSLVRTRFRRSVRGRQGSVIKDLAKTARLPLMEDAFYAETMA